MPAIPQVDINIVLNDTGYKFRFTEADTSTSLGRFGFEFPFEQPTGVGGTNQSSGQAFFPAYNTMGSPMTPTPQNFQLTASAAAPFAVSGSPPAFVLWGFDGTNFLQISWDFASGVVQAQLSTWTGAIDYSGAGYVNLNISNPDTTSGVSLYPVVFTDGSKGFVFSAQVGGNNSLLPIPLDLTTPIAWVSDPSPVNPNFTITAPFAGINYFGDGNSLPTINVWQVTFDLTVPTAMVVTWNMTATGDVSSDAVNGLLPEGWNFDGAFYYTPIGFFGIDWNSGNNTGCWYCKYDCTAFGRVTFTMPDASLGPSSDPSVYWVNEFYNGSPSLATQQFQFYPNWDHAGNAWWIRVPLQTGGSYQLEPLTGEVYTSLSPSSGAAKIFGSFVGAAGAGAVLGGTK